MEDNPIENIGEDNVTIQPPKNAQNTPSQPRGRGTKRPTATSSDSDTGGVAKKGKRRSWLWDHFNEITRDGKKRAECHYCTQKLLALQSELSAKNNGIDDANNKIIERKGRLEVWKFNQQDTRLALSKMIIMDERPFRTVEQEGFRLFMSVACPHFVIPSRWTVARDCKIINFCSIVGHTGEIIGKAIENCLIEWGITTKVLTVTVDNASANDVGVEYLRERLISWNGAVLEGKYLQMRCAAHILSLTVREGLKEAVDSIVRIRNAVRFVRSSPARLSKFNNCVKKEQIDSNRHLCLDVETRWNSTYLMLDSALIYRKAFHKLETFDGGKFRSELEKNLGVPVDSDWERLMASGMKRKHDKYWDNLNKVNMLLYIAVILDPRRKMQYVNWAINQQYDFVKSEKLRSMVTDTLSSLYSHYTSCQPTNVPSPPPPVDLCAEECENMDDWQDMVESQFERDVSGDVVNDKKSDLDKYLEDAREINSKTFDVLCWWKKHEEVYPILSLMARDVLAIPVSIVASEYAFSTGGRILDPFRSSLTSKMVEGLVCAQNWLRSNNGPVLAEEYIDELEKIDKDLVYCFLNL
ncbi:hypothetical protein RND81_05G159700 [Saponaria officinalis]|uniref:Transposase n=1 Tax=Saponaria officinalis TaxID=3572 RepID=A0AAW1KY50_SAPOF